MNGCLLIVNAGSSSLKFSVFRDLNPPELALRGQIESLQSEPKFVARDAAGNLLDERTWPAGSPLGHSGAIQFLFDWIGSGKFGEFPLTAAGHRVVHGGVKFTKPIRVDDTVLADLKSLIPLAPLHQPHHIAAVQAVTDHAPALPQVVCFDTSFHRSQPTLVREYAIPRSLSESGIQRYGFHGLSYEYIASRLQQIDPHAATSRTIVAHLGNGASLCALRGGVSLATTMGFTPLDGLPMGTRCGTIDPGVLLYLMNERSMDAKTLGQLLTNESGLLGVSGISSDVRTLLEKEATDVHAAESIEMFVYRITREIGSLVAALEGLDAIVFTGGIGEHAAPIRDRVCRALRWLDIELDRASNEQHQLQISSPTSRRAVWVIPTNEELMIALHTQAVLNSQSL